MDPRRNVWIFCASLAVALAIVLGTYLVGCISSFISAMKHAEFANLATRCVSDAVAQYVRERGRWPASWDDLTSVCPAPDDNGLFKGGWREVERYTKVDFNMRLSEVAAQRAEDFRAIAPIPPVVANYHQSFVPLLEAAREVLDAETERKTGPTEEATSHGRP